MLREMSVSQALYKMPMQYINAFKNYVKSVNLINNTAQ